MIITELDLDIDQRITNMDQSEVRSAGVHVSNVIKLIETTQGRLKGRDDLGEDSEAKWKDYRNAGFIIERVMKMLWISDTMVRPGELLLDGIYMTPDFLDTVAWSLIEMKCTWRSMPTDPSELYDKFWSWLSQIKAYCKALGLLKAELWVFFVNGDYRPRKPRFRKFKLEFEQWELDENWAMIRNWAKDVKEGN